MRAPGLRSYRPTFSVLKGICSYEIIDEVFYIELIDVFAFRRIYLLRRFFYSGDRPGW